jgi:hypothetical protein
MTLHGTVVNGTIVLDQPAPVPDGTRVQLTLQQETPTAEPAKATLAFLLKYAGCMSDLPADYAEQHDHYIHGTPKR